MRGFPIVAVCSLLLGAFLSAQEPSGPLPMDLPMANTQDLIFPDHPVFREWRDVFLLAGRALPSSVGPLSRREMLVYLSLLPETRSELESQLRQRVQDRLRPRLALRQANLAFEFHQTLHPEFYVGNVLSPEDWYRTYYTQPSLYRGDFRFWGGSFLAFAFDLPVAVEPFAVLDRSGPMNSNLVFNLGEWNKYFPFRGYVAAGGEFWSLHWGRGKLSYGPGRTGNLLLSDAADWADFLGLSLFWESFKFHTVIINQDWYAYALDNGLPLRHPSGWYRSAEGAQNRSRFHTFHRLEFRPWNTLTISLIEAGAVETYGFDFRFLNPFFVYHNWFLSENSDSNAGIDWEWVPLPNLGFWGAVLFDYITTPYKDQVFHDTRPLAFAVQFGGETLWPLDSGLIRAMTEAVYVSSYAYTDRNFNWVQWRRHLSDYGQIRGRALLEQPLGYILGPDSALLQVALSWEVPRLGKVGLESRIAYKGQNHLLTRNPEHPNASDPPLEPPPYEKPGGRVGLRGWVEWELESVGLPPFWTIRVDALAQQKSRLDQTLEATILQGAFGLRIEW